MTPPQLTMTGGYDDGYRACGCFWGNTPGKMIVRLDRWIKSYSNLVALDAGCGEGKNSWHLAQKGASVLALDCSELAIAHATEAWPSTNRITWLVADIRQFELTDDQYDIVIAYGLLHCLNSVRDIKTTVERLKRATKHDGYHVVCAFNDRHQELEAHPGFDPSLMTHAEYLNLYSDWAILDDCDTDLTETHPHNRVQHTHSLTRLIARKS